jgi:hypothetical protein
MRNAECGMRNEEEILLIKSAFRIPHSTNGWLINSQHAAVGIERGHYPQR